MKIKNMDSVRICPDFPLGPWLHFFSPLDISGTAPSHNHEDEPTTESDGPPDLFRDPWQGWRAPSRGELEKS